MRKEGTFMALGVEFTREWLPDHQRYIWRAANDMAAGRNVGKGSYFAAPFGHRLHTEFPTLKAAMVACVNARQMEAAE